MPAVQLRTDTLLLRSGRPSGLPLTAHPRAACPQNQNGATAINQDRYTQDTAELVNVVEAFLKADVYDPSRAGLIEKIKTLGNKWVRPTTAAAGGLAWRPPRSGGGVSR